MKKLWATGIALLFGASMFLAYPLSTWAGEQDMAQSACQLYTSQTQYPEISGLRGTSVLDQNGQVLGRVASVTFDESGGVTNFIIVSSCLPGTYGKLVAIPYKSSAYAIGAGPVTLIGASMKEFRDAPSFSSNAWETGQLPHNWAQEAYHYWETTPYFG
jgi:sporulation protein YlmC with PRC-barrel domain